MTKDNQLFRPIFLISVLVLIINDLFLKYEYHNYLTGKLSDVAGLFAFPYFLSCFLKKRIKQVYLLTGVLFIFWKSELSQAVFDYAHYIGIGINRTVDYVDLIALVVLPFSYKYYYKLNYPVTPKSSRILKPLVIGICIFSFIATTLPKQVGEFNMGSELEMNFPIDIKKAKESYTLYESEQENKYIYRVNVPGKRATIATLIEIEKKDNGITRIKLDSILSYQIESSFLFSGGTDEKDIQYLENLRQSQIEELFVQQIKKEVKSK